jgi:hypothetical protein
MKGIHSSTNTNLTSLEINDSDYMFDFDGLDDGNHENSRSSFHQSNQPFSDLEESDSEGKIIGIELFVNKIIKNVNCRPVANMVFFSSVEFFLNILNN